MKINKQELQQALEIVKPALANSELIEQSTSFAFFKDRVVTYNDSISIAHPISGLKLEGAIRAEQLYEFLKRTDAEDIQLIMDESELKMKAKNARAGITLQQEIVLPIEEAGNPTNWEDLPEDFMSDLDFIKGSASNDMSRRVLTCVHVEENRLIASDGFQIMRVFLDPENPFPYPGQLIPAENISEIVKIAPQYVAQTPGWLHFKNGNGTQISCRILMDDYPDTEGHFDMKGDKLLFPKKMSDILEKAMVFTKQDHFMDEEMEIKLKNNTLLVHGKNEHGWFKEKAPVKYEGKEASFWINPYLLQNILGRSNKCTLGEERIRFEGEGWEYVAVLIETD